MKSIKNFIGLTWMLCGVACQMLAADAKFESLFNGKDLNGWEGDPKFWSVEDGCIVGKTTPQNPTKGNTFLIWRQGQLEDFELVVKYKLVGNNPEKWGNSGIQYRSKDHGNFVVGGYQADIEGGPTYTGILYEERGRGILANRGEKVTVDASGKVKVTGSVGNSKDIQSHIKSEDWNEYVILAQGNKIVHKINGHTTMELTDEQVEKRSFKGILAFQVHAGKPMSVYFKDIQLKRLPKE